MSNIKNVYFNKFVVLAWLRLNCMEVFHYVALQLENMPIFEYGDTCNTPGCSGAIYNDFDFNPAELLQDSAADEMFFSQSTNSEIEVSVHESVLVPQIAIDHAVLEADKTEAALYEYLSFDTELLDVKSKANDEEYMDKVYKLVAFEWREISKFVCGKALEIYEMRYRSKWDGADSVYDAWLITMKRKRKWFPYKMFLAKYPRWEKVRNQHTRLLLSEESESSDEDVCLEDTSKRKNVREDEEKESKKRIKMFVPKVQETNVIVISDSE